MATEPLATVATPELPATGKRIGFKEAMGIQEPFLKKQAELLPQISEARGDVAQAKQAQAETLATGKQQAAETLAGAESTARERMAGRMEAEPLPAFVPTQDNVQDIAGLFSLIGVLGMVAGKSNAMQAMNAMNGMLEGHRKGRKDLYQQERQTFEKNFQTMLKKHAEFRNEMEDAIKTAQTDYQAGMAKAELAAAKAGSTIVQAELRQGRLVDSYKFVEDSKKGGMEALGLEAKARQAEATETAAAKRHKETMAQQERLRLAQTASRGQLFQGSDQKMYSFDPATNKVTPVDTPEGVKLTRPTGGGTGAGAAAGQIERMMNSMTQVTGAVRSVADLPVSTTAPVFGQKDFKGIFLAPLSALNQTMSKETSQMLQGRMIGVARNLASLETGGAATGLAGLTESIEKGISIPAGAKLHVALDKLAEMRRIVDDAARAALASSKYTDDQKQLIRENLAIVERAIPFTLEDVRDATVAAKGKSPKVPKEDQSLSFTDYINKYGLAKSESQSGGGELTPDEQAELEELRKKHGRR